jgi:hypothetical protein
LKISAVKKHHKRRGAFGRDEQIETFAVMGPIGDAAVETIQPAGRNAFTIVKRINLIAFRVPVAENIPRLFG